jgi:hypothetical protein
VDVSAVEDDTRVHARKLVKVATACLCASRAHQLGVPGTQPETSVCMLHDVNVLCCTVCQQAGLSGVAHIGVRKDYSPVIQAALESEGFTTGVWTVDCCC